MDVICIPVPLGVGGLGRHGACLVEHYGQSRILIPKPEKFKSNKIFNLINRVGQRLRLVASQSVLDGYDAADRFFTTELQEKRISGNQILCFSGCALSSFRKARENRFRELHLESPTAHISYCARQFEMALRMHDLEKSWLDTLLINKMLAEYQEADIIWVNSEYSYKTFLNEGIPSYKLHRRYLQAENRFHQKKVNNNRNSSRFLFIGSVTVLKGVPLLIEAFRKLKKPSARLTLVGGTCSRGMSLYMRRAILMDPRISIFPGDPLPHLVGSNLLIHPSWCDGLGFAGLEAVAMGVPVLVSEDSGMKEYVKNGVNGFIIPTGCVDAIYDKLKAYS